MRRLARLVPPCLALVTRLALVTFLALVSLPVAADVTVVSNVENSGMAAAGNGESTMYIKGLKMRQEQTVQGRKTATILDVENKRMIQLDFKKERAEIFDLSQVAAQQAAIGAAAVDVSLDANGRSETVAGESCAVHELRVKVSIDASQGAGGMDMMADVLIAGPVCLVADAPGSEDYQRFFVAMAESGLFLGDPRAAEAQPGQQKGISQMYRVMAEKGVAYHSDLNIGFEGSGFMAKMLEKMSFDSETTVVSVSTDALPDALFEVPAGWKSKTID